MHHPRFLQRHHFPPVALQLPLFLSQLGVLLESELGSAGCLVGEQFLEGAFRVDFQLPLLVSPLLPFGDGSDVLKQGLLLGGLVLVALLVVVVLRLGEEFPPKQQLRATENACQYLFHRVGLLHQKLQLLELPNTTLTATLTATLHLSCKPTLHLSFNTSLTVPF